MAPRICKGDYLKVSSDWVAKSGDIVFAGTRTDHGYHISRFIRYGDHGSKVRLVCTNPDYPPQEFDLKDFCFIYPVVELYRKL